MARKKAQEKPANHERWLVSYGDFITLLFAVFVTLYAMSQTDKKKVDQVIASMRESFGYSKTGASADRPTLVESTDLRAIPAIRPEILTPGKGRFKYEEGSAHKGRAEEKDFKEIKNSIETYLMQRNAQDKVSVEITQRGLVVSLKEAGFFDSGSAVVKPTSFPLLAKVAESLSNHSNPIRIEGHTDTVPIRSGLFQSNWELSTARATNIVHYLIDHYSFSPNKLSATGFGEHRPIADNQTVDGRQKNRRVDIVMLTKESEGGEP